MRRVRWWPHAGYGPGRDTIWGNRGGAKVIAVGRAKTCRSVVKAPTGHLRGGTDVHLGGGGGDVPMVEPGSASHTAAA
jgi:hypothetical protein